MESPGLTPGRQRGGFAVQDERGSAGSGARPVAAPHLDLGQREPAEPRAERFHHRFLGGEACRQGFGRIRGATGVGPFDVGEEAGGEPGPSGQDAPETHHIDCIDPDADHRARGRRRRPATRRRVERGWYRRRAHATVTVRAGVALAGDASNPAHIPTLPGVRRVPGPRQPPTCPSASFTTVASRAATSSAWTASRASTITRTRGSVPLGRSSTLPSWPSSASALATASQTSHCRPAARVAGWAR